MSTSGASTPGAGPSVPKDQMDLYRPLAKDIQKSITPYAQSSDTPQLTDLLSLDVNAYAHRLANKSLFLAESAPEASGSSLVKGKKRNRGSDSARKAARDEVEGRRAEMEKDGLVGLRRVKKRLGGVVKRGSRIEYHTLIPLNHLHTQYLINLFALPPLPSIQASLDTTTGASRPVSSNTRTQASVPGWPKSVPSIDSISSKLLKADFTGISLKVISSRNASLVGISGIVVEETASTFALVSSDDKVRVVPKDGTQFELRIPLYAPAQQTTSTVESEGPNAQDDLDDRPEPIDMAAHIANSPSFLITLLGSNFCFRSGERAGRKFKLAQETGGGNGWGEGWVRGPWSEVLDAMEPQSSRQSGLGKKSHQASDEGHPIDSLNDAGAITKSPSVRRKKGKSRRKDPLPGGSLEVFF